MDAEDSGEEEIPEGHVREESGVSPAMKGSSSQQALLDAPQCSAGQHARSGRAAAAAPFFLECPPDAEASSWPCAAIANPRDCFDCPSNALHCVLSSVCEATQHTTVALALLSSAVLNLGLHATKLTRSLGTAEQLWRDSFPMTSGDSEDGEFLRSFLFCQLLTTIGPCPGTLYLSSCCLYFASDKELQYNVAPGEVEECLYRVSVPYEQILSACPRRNPSNDIDTYIQVVTSLGFEFWFCSFIDFDSAVISVLEAYSCIEEKPAVPLPAKPGLVEGKATTESDSSCCL